MENEGKGKTDSTPEANAATKNNTPGTVEESRDPHVGDCKASQELNEEDEDEATAFELIGKLRPRKQKKNKSVKSKSISISIPSHTTNALASTTEKSVGDTNQHAKDDIINFVDIIDGDAFHAEEGGDDPLSFYSNTHEEQDPEYVEFHSSRLRNRLEIETAKLQKAKVEDMRKIQAYLSARWEESSDTLQRDINKVRSDVIEKQARQRSQLSGKLLLTISSFKDIFYAVTHPTLSIKDKHKKQIEEDLEQIKEGEKWLGEKQDVEKHKRIDNHAMLIVQQQRLSLPQSVVPDWGIVSAQLQGRHSEQLQQFEDKKAELEKRSEQELSAQNKILEAHHRKRKLEEDVFIKELVKNCHKQQENLKAKLTRLHEERFEKKQKDIQADCTFKLVDRSHPWTAADGKANGIAKHGANTPEVHVSHKSAKGGMHEGSISHDAVIRQKRRKNLTNNATIQLAIEIHNEGIIAVTRSNHQKGERRSSENNEEAKLSDKATGRTFFPWGGATARSILYSIVIGELPSGYFFDQIGAEGRKALGGGLVKCTITDTMSSDDTAALERAEILCQVQDKRRQGYIEEIERRYTNTCTSIANEQAESTVLMEKEAKLLQIHGETLIQYDRANGKLATFPSCCLCCTTS
jgi:hypothetical protein